MREKLAGLGFVALLTGAGAVWAGTDAGPDRPQIPSWPLVLLVGFFNGRRRLLHDIVLGTVIINNSVRSPVGQPARTF